MASSSFSGLPAGSDVAPQHYGSSSGPTSCETLVHANMTRWLLHEYRDRYDPLSEPRSVGVYEDVEAVIRAVASLKQARPKCLPIALIEGKRPEVLHVVYKADEWDSLFQSVELAYSWIEWQWYEHQRRPPGEVVRYSCTSILVDNFPAAEAPKTVWDWIRSPAPYSFDDA